VTRISIALPSLFLIRKAARIEESVVPPSAKPFPLATNKAVPRAGRSIRPRDFTLPKPYRRKRFVEDGPGMSRLRMLLLTLSALVISGLIATLVLLAKENLDSPPMPIIAAPAPLPAPAPLVAPAQSAVLPAMAAVPPPLPEQTPPARAPLPKAPPAPARLVRVAAPMAPTAIAPDPDVVLITAILTLTPPPEFTASCATDDDNCAAVRSPPPNSSVSSKQGSDP
jgi:hypothetical protein